VKGLTTLVKRGETAGGERGQISVCTSGQGFPGLDSSPLSGDSEELWPSNDSVEVLSPSPSPSRRNRPITVPLLLPLGVSGSHFETQVNFTDLSIGQQNSMDNDSEKYIDRDSEREIKHFDSYDQDRPRSPLGSSTNKNANLFPVGSAMQFARNKH
jgi:hypothetical protein